MLSFIGTSQHKVDAKGRVQLPSDFRKTIDRAGGQQVVLLPGARDPHSIEAFTATGYQNFVAQFEKSNLTAAQKSAVARRLAGRAKPVPMDENGRIVLPENMRDYAGLDGQALFVGLVSTFQIWKPERHAEIEAETDEIAGELIANMGWEVSNE